MLKKGPSEELVQRLWRARGTGRWPTASGQDIEVGYPGRCPGGVGPDFRGALLSPAAGLPHPREVEVHVRSSAWRAHGHHRDPRYGQVGLQVVVWQDTHEPCRGASGQEVPLVVLGAAMGKGALGQLAPAEPCRGAGERREWASLAGTLEAAGLERLRQRAGVLGEAISQRGPDQALYEGIMEALGYSQNRAPFLKLAQGLPFGNLQVLWAGLRPSRAEEVAPALYSWLLGAAGLGPVSRDLGESPVLAPQEWTVVGVRPANHPRHRLKAAATLLARYLGPGLVAGLSPYLEQGSALSAWRTPTRFPFLAESESPSKGVIGLEMALMVAGEPRCIGAPLGRDRAREMIVNGVLPTFYAWGQLQGQPQVTARALGLYTSCPAHGEDRVTRLLASQLWGKPRGLPRACYQQGCHYIFQRYCQPRHCGQCPLAY